MEFGLGGSLAVLTAFMAAVSSVAGFSAKGLGALAPLCHAFLKGDASNDLCINGGAGEERVTTGKNIWDFAVAMDASALALLEPRSIEIVSLKADFQKCWGLLDRGVLQWMWEGTWIRTT